MNQRRTFLMLPQTVALGLLLGGVLAVYVTTVQSLLERWNQTGSEYGHGLLLVGVIAWLIFRDRQRLLQADISACYWALAPAVVCSLLWSAGYITQVNIVQQVALPGVIFFSITTLTGMQVARIIWFPLALIVFALPFWNVLTPLLQHFAVTACAQLFSLLGTPIHISGNSIALTSGTFQIAAGCSGLNLFLAASILGILYAHLNFAARRDQFVVVLLALLLGIVCNWVRIITIILIAQISDNIQHPIVQDHGWLGWAWFAVLFSAYLFSVNRLPFAARHEQTDVNDLQARVAQRNSNRVSITTLIICMLGVYSAPLLSMYSLSRSDDRTATLVAPASLLGSPAYAIDDTSAWRPDFHGATGELHLRSRVNRKDVAFHLYFYAAQAQGAELIHFDNNIVDGERWRMVQSLPQHSTMPARRWKDVIVEDTASNKRQSTLVRYWYAIAGSNTTSSTSAKILQLKGFLRNRTDAALVALSSSCATSDCESTRQLFNEIAEPAAHQSTIIVNNILNHQSTD